MVGEFEFIDLHHIRLLDFSWASFSFILCECPSLFVSSVRPRVHYHFLNIALLAAQVRQQVTSLEYSLQRYEILDIYANAFFGNAAIAVMTTSFTRLHLLITKIGMPITRWVRKSSSCVDTGFCVVEVSEQNDLWCSDLRLCGTLVPGYSASPTNQHFSPRQEFLQTENVAVTCKLVGDTVERLGAGAPCCQLVPITTQYRDEDTWISHHPH